MRWLRDLADDAAYGTRSFAKAPGVAVTAIATLALGIGATTAIFSVVHALLMKPLPYARDGAALVRLIAHTPAPPGSGAPPRRGDAVFTIDEIREIGASLRTLTDVSLVGSTIMSLRGVEGAGHVTVGIATPEAFAALGVAPAIGRGLSTDPAQAAGEILVTHAGWLRHLAADPAVVGTSVTLDSVLGRRADRTFVVTGILPASFTFPRGEAAFWIAPPPAAAGAPPYRGRLLARLAPGTTVEAALAEIAPTVRAMRQQSPEFAYELVREQDELVGPVRPAVLVLGATVGALLLIACLNVANLLLARTLSRRHELSVRAAIGASRGRLARQCVAESALLGAAGGAGGLVVAALVLGGFRRLAATLPRIDLVSSGPGWGGAAFPRLDEVAIDGTVLVFATAVAIAAGIAGGLVAAWRAATADGAGAFRPPGGTLRAEAATTRRVLVVGQVACAMALLVAAVLLSRSLQRLLTTAPGYLTDGVTTFQVGLPSHAYPDDRLRTFAESLTERVRAIPGVEVAAYANQVPMVQLRDTAGGLWTTPDPARRGAPDGGDARFVSRDYLRAMGITLLAGRSFDERDGAGRPRVLLVNDALVRRQFPGQDPIGLQVFVGRDTAPWTIVGVVRDVRQFALDRAPEPQFFADLRQWAGGMPLFPGGAYYVVKSRVPVAALLPELRAIARGLDAEAALFNVTSMDAIVASSVARPRLYAAIVGMFALLGAVLSAIGVYGVLAFAVQQRTSEIGVRMALGASPASVLGMVARQGGGLVAAGLAVGLGGGVALARAAAGLLYAIQPLDPVTYVAASALFATVAAVAIVIPARRATRVDPMAALRCE